MITRPGLMDLFHPVDFFLPIWLFLPSFLPSFHKRIGPEEVSRYYQIIALRHWRVELQPEELKTGRCALFDDLNWESAERWNGSYFRVLKQEERERKIFPPFYFFFSFKIAPLNVSRRMASASRNGGLSSFFPERFQLDGSSHVSF